MNLMLWQRTRSVYFYTGNVIGFVGSGRVHLVYDLSLYHRLQTPSPSCSTMSSHNAMMVIKRPRQPKQMRRRRKHHENMEYLMGAPPDIKLPWEIALWPPHLLNISESDLFTEAVTPSE